jgi:diguanylate cyclase (GGDEF)-like protein
VEAADAGQIPRSREEREVLAKEWLLRMIERTPLPEVPELSVPWVVSEAPPLIATILAALGDPEAATSAELEPEEVRRAEALSSLRDGPHAPSQIPRDLAALQGLVVEAVRREVPEREPGDFARAVGRIVDVFGSIQGEVTRSLVESRGGGAASDQVTGLPGPVQLDEWLHVLLAEQRRYGHNFALALVDVDGLARINEAHGRPTGDRMLAAVSGVLRRQLRDVDQAFRLEEDEFAILAPHTDAAGLVPMASRIAELVASSQSDDGPRIAVAAGVVSCPTDGASAERLLESAAEATYAAKASGAAVGRSAAGSESGVQDR